MDWDAPDVEKLLESEGSVSEEVSDVDEVDVLESGREVEVEGGGEPEVVPELSGGVPDEDPGRVGSIGSPEMDDPEDP